MNTRKGIAIFVCLLLLIFLIASFRNGCNCSKSNQVQTVSNTAQDPNEKADDIAPAPWVQLAEIALPNEGKPSLQRNFYFIFDSSGSMQDDYNGEQKIEGAKKATRNFMEKVPKDINLGLYVYDINGGKELLRLGPRNHQAFLQKIEGLVPGGNTPLGDAVRFGTKQLTLQYQKQLGYGEFRLIVITDGLANDMDDFLKALKYATAYRIPIYAIGIDVEGDNYLRQYAVSYREANNSKDLQKALENTLAELPSFDTTEFKK
jgi:Ca-activated chloride channel homolog